MARFTGGWVKMHRKNILDYEFVSRVDGYGQAILNILVAMAAYKENNIPTGFGPLKPGELVTSDRELCDLTKFSRKTVRSRLEALKQHGFIEIFRDRSRDRSGTKVTICNYEEYRGFVDEQGTHSGTYNKNIKEYNTNTYVDLPKKETEKPMVSSEPKSSCDDVCVAFLNLWNENRGSLPEAKKITPDRKAKIKSRLKEEPSLEYWQATIKRLAASPFCRGDVPNPNGSTWRADFDWLLKPGKHVRVNEGLYDPKPRVLSLVSKTQSISEVFG